ncbi:peptidoglycan recognition protein family protein [Actinomadura macrotermitis]|uniref:N-acetylmuramoyl-L-alanine amidase n=1 Tax=Actinomadura macrotermitis TaxID=2585200 RepID=A0A7K0BXG7_9ACTN|nr:peptidoglycan recognition family protein [Actinomadura macrotermitis]MQY05344.1 hypothetical protein [Actinomadura macrotermitis]
MCEYPGEERKGAPPTRRAVLGVLAALGIPLPIALGMDNEAMAATPDQRLPARPGPGPRPLVHARSSWHARPPRRPATVLRRAPDRIVVHHTATPNSTDYSLEHAYALSRAIQRFHMDGRGWDDSGQQLTISRGGHIMEGRNTSLASIAAGRHTLGAHALQHNEHAVGIENEGTYMEQRVPGTLWRSLVDVCAWLCDEYRLDPFRAIVGHRDYGETDCPGDVLYGRLPFLRESVAARLGRPRWGDEDDEDDGDERRSGSRDR